MLVFVLMHAVPGGPFDELKSPLPAAAKANILHKYGLDQPLWVQYALYMWHALQGDFGIPYESPTETVLGLIARVWPVTLLLGAIVIGLSFTLGLGISTPQLAEGLHDVAFEAPLGRLRRTIGQVRALLRGERIPLAVVTGARPLKLNVPPPPAIPIYVAAIGDQSVRLTGELADGWVPFIYPRSCLAQGVERLREGAARGGHPDRLPLVCPSVPAVVAADEAKAREGAAWFVAFYLVSMGTLYRQSLMRQGFGKEVEAVLAANAPKFTGIVPPDAEALLEELIVFGTPSQARARLAAWHTAGAAMPVLLLRPQLSPDELDFTLDALRPR